MTEGVAMRLKGSGMTVGVAMRIAGEIIAKRSKLYGFSCIDMRRTSGMMGGLGLWRHAGKRS